MDDSKGGHDRMSDTEVRFGHVAKEIIKVSEEEQVDMIILGCCRTLVQKLLMGDVAHEVVSKAKVPVLLAK